MKSASRRSPTTPEKTSSAQKTHVRGLLAAAYDKLASDPAEASLLADAALQAARSLSDSLLHGEAALALAACHHQRADLPKASEFVEESLQAFERAGKSSRLGRVYKLQALVFSMQDRVSLALAAAVKSLSYPDLEPKDRAFVFCVIGSCFSRLFDVPTAVDLMERRALPEANTSGDPQAIVACYLRTASYLNMCAVWSAGIPHYLTVGIRRPDNLASPAEYLERAMRYLDVCEKHGDNMLIKDRPYFFAERASAVALRDGYEHALPIFAQARAVTSDLIPVTKPFVLLDHAATARIAGRWDEALALIQEMQRLPAWHIWQRTVFFELSCIYRALGKDQEALRALEKFTDLQTNMARLANTWVDDALNQRRYGKQLDLSHLRSSVLDAAEPTALQRASRYVESNLHRRLALSDVARESGVSVRTLQSLYQNFHGVSASAFIKELKMQRAHQMLAGGDVSVYQTADAIGYSSPHNLSRDFRERFGYAPSDVRPNALSDKT